MPTITRKLEFDYGHRILNHESKCRHLHGHRGVAEITVYSPGLDPLGRVVDFSVIKEVVGGWIDNHLDHNMLLHPEDELAKLFEDLQKPMTLSRLESLFGGKTPYILPYDYPNPTAENISRLIFEKATSLLRKKDDNLRVVSVRFWETPNSFSDYPDNENFKQTEAGES